MNNLIIMLTLVVITIVFLLMAFAIFAIGFLIGYKREDNLILKRKQRAEMNEMSESEQEKKIKKEWKRFLEYDGTTPSGVE